MGLLAAITEAWQEVRVHRVRVVLSLVGVFLAVFAMTTITAVGRMGAQMLQESSDRSQGRAATLQLDVYSSDGSSTVDAESMAQLRSVVARHGIPWSSLTGSLQFPARLPAGTKLVSGTIVEPRYGEMHRIQVLQGRWFTDADTDRFAPALVVDQQFADGLGGFDPAAPPTVVLGGDTPVRATVIGVVDDRNTDGVSAWVLPGDVERWISADTTYGSAQLGMQVWVPDGDAEALQQVLQQELTASVPGGNAGVYRYDSGEELGVVNVVLAYGVRGIGIFALVLGGIGVLNVGLVTVRQRIREIGVRRSFGATSGRVFFAVLFESVCATAAAGALAVLLSVAIISNLPLSLILPQGISLTDVPPYPWEAALEGFLAATAIGALAGLVPAVMAVRAQVIDAIRY